jgi:hypothetical protein
MRARKVYEAIDFERGTDPRKSLDIGLAAENKDPQKLVANIKAAFPEITFTYNATSQLHAPGGPHPIWKMLTVNVGNPKDGVSLEERGQKFLDWIKKYTTFTDYEIRNSHERRWYPFNKPELGPEEHSQSFEFAMK